jgi:hypothetical protein
MARQVVFSTETFTAALTSESDLSVVVGIDVPL